MSDRKFINAGGYSELVRIDVRDPFGTMYDDPWHICLSIPEAKDFLKELRRAIREAEKLTADHFSGTVKNFEKIGES